MTFSSMLGTEVARPRLWRLWNGKVSPQEIRGHFLVVKCPLWSFCRSTSPGYSAGESLTILKFCLHSVWISFLLSKLCGIFYLTELYFGLQFTTDIFELDLHFWLKTLFIILLPKKLLRKAKCTFSSEILDIDKMATRDQNTCLKRDRNWSQSIKKFLNELLNSRIRLIKTMKVLMNKFNFHLWIQI